MAERGTGNDGLKIVGITLTYNEEKRIPYVMPYYELMGIDKLVVYDNGSTDNTIEELSKYPFVEIRHYETDGEMNNDEFLRIKNEKWKEFKDDYDWCIVSDFDEVIYCDGNIREVLADAKGTIFQKTLMDLFSEEFLDTHDELLHKVLGCGTPWIYGIDFHSAIAYGNKHILFNLKEVDTMDYHFGAHTCSPKGRIEFFTDDRIFAFHLKYLDKEYILRKSEENYKRQIAKGKKGTSRPEYLKNKENLDYTYEILEKNKILVSEYNSKLHHGLYYPLEILFVTRATNPDKIRQLAFSIDEKIFPTKDIYYNWLIINNGYKNKQDYFNTTRFSKWETFVVNNGNENTSIDNFLKERQGDFWVYFIDENTIIHANLPFIMRKITQTCNKKVICLNSEDKDGEIIKKSISLENNNILIHKSKFKNGTPVFTKDDIIYEEDATPLTNKVSSFNNMARTKNDFAWDYCRLDLGEVTLKIQSQWERIPLVYEVPKEIRREILSLIQKTYEKNGLI